MNIQYNASYISVIPLCFISSHIFTLITFLTNVFHIGNLWEKYENHQPYTRYKRWYECSKTRKKVRDVCILGVYDMVALHKAPDMFANKFFPYFHPLARMCLEERIMNRTREQLQGKAKLDLTPYKILSFVKNHAPS